MVAPAKPKPQIGESFVILHTVVGGWPTEWYVNRVVLSDEYNQQDPAHPEWDLSPAQLTRLGDLGAIRDPTTDEAAAAQAAKDAAVAAGTPWTGYYLTPDEAAEAV